MEREFKEIETPIGKNKIKIKSWLTGFEKRKIQSIFLNNTEFSMSGENADLGKIKGDVLSKSQDVTIEQVICSVDEKTEGILDLIGELHYKDFDFVLSEIDKIHNDKKEDIVEASKKKEN